MNINQLPLSEAELRQRALEYRTALDSEEEICLQLLIFSLEGQLFACSVQELQETLPLQEIVQLPDMHPAVSGLTNLRGSLLLTCDLRRFLGISTETPAGHILVVKSGPYQTGLLVDAIKKVEGVPQTLFQSGMEIKSGVAPAFILGVGMVQETPLLWLDINKIVVKLESILAGN